MKKFRYKLVLQRVAILVLMTSIVAYIRCSIESLQRYYTEHAVTEIGMCTEYKCAVKLGPIYAVVSGPVMVGQTVYIHCDNYNTNEMKCDKYAQLNIRMGYLEKPKVEG